MNAKKTLTALALLAGLASVPDASALSYLYWQVDLADNPNNVPEFSYATVSGDGQALYCYDSNGNVLEGSDRVYVSSYDDVGGTGAALGRPVYSGFNLAASSYLFELWTESAEGDSTRVGWATYSYSALSDYIYTTMQSGKGATPLMVAVVPEPTGALLMFIGLAGLALRRKPVTKA